MKIVIASKKGFMKIELNNVYKLLEAVPSTEKVLRVVGSSSDNSDFKNNHWVDSDSYTCILYMLPILML